MVGSSEKKPKDLEPLPGIVIMILMMMRQMDHSIIFRMIPWMFWRKILFSRIACCRNEGSKLGVLETRLP